MGSASSSDAIRGINEWGITGRSAPRRGAAKGDGRIRIADVQ